MVDDWMLEAFAGMGLKGTAKVLWCCAVKTLLWTAWKERNQRAFEDNYSSEYSFVDSIRYLASWWCTR